MMQILRGVFDDNDRIFTREELLLELKGYRNILSGDLYKYFESLIDLDFSVFKNYSDDVGIINDVFREKVCGLNIYKNIGIYNIYNHALDIFKREENNFPIEIFDSDRGLRVNGRVSDIGFPIFDYSMSNDGYSRFIDDYKSIKMGDVNLYRIKAFDEDDDVKNIYDIVNNFDKIRTYRDSDKNYSIYSEQCAIQEYFCEVFRDSYDLHEDDSFDGEVLKDNVLSLVKKYPGASVRDNIKYI